MIETYLSSRPKGKSHKKIIHSLETIETIIDALINQYGLEALYNDSSRINADLIFGYGLILKLENQLSDSPSPTTIRKHIGFIEALIQRKSDEISSTRTNSSH